MKYVRWPLITGVVLFLTGMAVNDLVTPACAGGKGSGPLLCCCETYRGGTCCRRAYYCGSLGPLGCVCKR